MQSSATCQASPSGDWARGANFPRLPSSGFRGWQVNPNSIFGDGAFARDRQWRSGSAPSRNRCREAQRAHWDRRAYTGLSRRMWQELNSTAASTSAPLRRAPLRLRRLSDSTGYEENRKRLKLRGCRGTSVSPLDKTYHGGPRTTVHRVVVRLNRLSSLSGQSYSSLQPTTSYAKLFILASRHYCMHCRSESI